MAKKFEAPIEALKLRIESAGINGKWTEDGKGKYTFTSDQGGVQIGGSLLEPSRYKEKELQ